MDQSKGAAEALGELLMQIIVHPLPVPSQIAPVPPGFDGWWLRAASRDPAGRFQSAKELSDELNLALGVTAEAAHGLRAPEAVPAPVYSPSASLVGQAMPGFDSSAPEPPASPSTVPASSTTGVLLGDRAPLQPGRSRALISAGVVVVALGILGGLALLRRVAASTSARDLATTASAMTTATAEASALSVQSVSVPSESEAPIPARATASVAMSSTPSTTVARKLSAPASPPAKPAAPPPAEHAPSCNPPYIVDAEGARHAKPECL